ncbi:MAG TPA: indole-3-glycerol phosphate synthase TrpC [Bryobacteraceae bacterium]|nr:indole-3-glycerol phosphate synthase TrpC [Bryobacteraceae bacterium]
MVHTVPDILARIVDRKRDELTELRGQRDELEKRAEASTAGRRDFVRSIARDVPSIIGEIKKASPSKGVFAADFRPAELAKAYEAGGARALSVLTDRIYFQGSLADLAGARSAVRLPVLRKDFTLDEVHVLEAAAHHADAILLIVAVLGEKALRHLREFAAQYSLAALVEAHDETELQMALASGAQIVGVNNRDLHTFEVHLQTSLDLAARIPAGVIKVTESGIHSRADIVQLHAAGYHAFLVGEHLMKSGDATAALRELTADWMP